MNPGLTALAIGIVAAGVIAIATRDARSAVVATLVVLVASPVLAGSLPEPLPLAARLVGAILAAYLLWAAVRGVRATAGTPLGLAAELLLAAAGGVAGWAVAADIGGRSASGGPVAGAAAGAALLAIAAGPAFTGREALRSTIGALLAVQGGWLVRGGLLGPAPAIDDVAVSVMLGTVGAMGAALVARARAGSGGLELGARRAVVATAAGGAEARLGRGSRHRLGRGRGRT